MEKILVVDDDDMVRLLTCQALESLGVEIEAVDGGQGCLERFRQSSYNLVLLDLEMPGMDGFETCARLRDLPGGADLAIIVITGLDDHESIHRAYQAGATDFITKPINWPILVQRVRYILRAQKNFIALRESEFTLSEAQRLAQLGHWIWDLVHHRFSWSDEALRILGVSPSCQEATFETFMAAVHPADREKVNAAIGKALQRGDSYHIEHRIVHPDGTEYTVNSRGVVIHDETGKPYKIRNIIQDITELKQAEAQIHQLFYYSKLTGLPNRKLFMEHAGKALALAQEEENNVFFILLDLDRFQRINDSLGHEVGDELLKRVALRVTDSISPMNSQDGVSLSLAHLGGDEFILTLYGSVEANQVVRLSQKLLKNVSFPIRCKDQEIYITASAGIAAFPQDGGNLQELLKNADVALSYAKKAGRNCFRFYAAEMNHRALERLSLETQLNRALENNALEVYYQPQIDLASGKVSGLEALLRWRHPDGAMISPAEFIPLAEETGLIVPMGEWVLNTACAQMAAWQRHGYASVQVAVNLSARQFASENLPELVQSALRSSGIDPRFLELELTETTIMQDAKSACVTLQELKDLGVKLAVDDFGQGYSSMSYLKYFPLDTLKIDRSFVRDLDMDTHNEAIVKAMIALSHGLGLKTVCEGVETENQWTRLRQLDADRAQGFLISKPVPACQVTVYLTHDFMLNKPAA